MFQPIPNHVLTGFKEVSKMQCKPSMLPEKIDFVDGANGRKIFFDGSIAIVISKRIVNGATDSTTKHAMHVFFYERTLSMFAATDGLKVFLGDLLVDFPCGEALFHMIKAVVFGDWDAFWKIYYSSKPGTCKEEGNRVQGFIDAEWNRVCLSAMEEVARLKLASLDVFKFFKAVATAAKAYEVEDVLFFECSKKDKKYGIGKTVLEAVKLAQDATADEVFSKTFLLDEGFNFLGQALAAALKVFRNCNGVQCETVADLMSFYETATGRHFYTCSFLQVEDLDRKADLEREGSDSKKAKVGEANDIVMLVESVDSDALLTRELSEAPLTRELSEAPLTRELSGDDVVVFARQGSAARSMSSC